MSKRPAPQSNTAESGAGDPREAPARGSEAGPQRSRSRWPTVRDWVILFAGAILGVAGTIAAEPISDAIHSRPPPIGEQLEDLRGEVADADRRVVLERALPVHGGERSYVLITRPTRYPTKAKRVGPEFADVMRVYDTIDGRLELQLRFKPEILPRPRPGLALQVDLLDTGDFDRDGTQEFIVNIDSYDPNFEVDRADAFVVRPIAVAWDDAAGDYRISPLLSERPDALEFGPSTRAARSRKQVYRQRVEIVDRTTDRRVRSYAAKVALTLHRRGHVFFVTGWVVKEEGTTVIVTQEGGVSADQEETGIAEGGPLFSSGRGKFAVGFCASGGLNLLGPVIHSDVTERHVRRAWIEFLPDTNC